MVRDFTYIDDVVKSIEKLVHKMFSISSFSEIIKFLILVAKILIL